MTQSLSQEEQGLSLPPRRERHGSSKKKIGQMKLQGERKDNGKKQDAPISDSATRSLLSGRSSQKDEHENEEKMEKTQEKKGSLVVANSILWCFLLFVGFVLYYTVRHYS